MANSSLRTGNTSNSDQNTGNTSNSDASLDNQSVDNNSHPLFFHNNDQPGMILISRKLLGSENFSSWKR